jgi:hypothetical protein
MSLETYRREVVDHDGLHSPSVSYVPDSRLQAIADAWHELEVAPFYFDVIRNQAPDLVTLLDALQEDTNG